MNSSECKSGIDSTYLLSSTEVFILQVTYCVGILSNLISKSLLAVVLTATSQLKITSTYLTLTLAASDMSFQLFSNVPYLFLLKIRANCLLETGFSVLRHFLFTLSKGFIVLISFDRYQHIKNPNRYPQIMTTKKVRLLQLVAVAVSFFIAALSLINFTALQWTVTALIMPPMFAILGTIVFFDMRSLQLLNEHKIRRKKFSKKFKALAKDARNIIIVYIIFYFVTFGVTVANSTVDSRYRYFVFWLKQCYAGYYPSVNAICFLCSNIHSKRYFKKLVRENLQCNKVEIDKD